MLNGVVLRKLRSLDDTLEELYSLGSVTLDLLKDDWRTLRAAERDLQILIEIVVDVCQRLISLAGETPAETGAEAVKRCVKLGALSSSEPYYEDSRKSCFPDKIFGWKRTSQSSFQLRSEDCDIER